jgi:hypothetical protein
MAYVLTIDGVDVTAALMQGWSIDATANGRNLFRGRLKSAAGTYRPALDDEVILTEGGVGIFGGTIVRAPESGLAPPKATSIITAVEAHDFNALAERRYVSFDAVAGASLYNILLEMATWLPGVAVHAAQVNPGPTLPSLNYRDVLARDVLDDLTTQSGGWLWDIDADRKLQMWLPGSRVAPFDVTEANRRAVGDILVDPVREGYANRVTVRAGPLFQAAQDASWFTSPYEALYTAPDGTPQDALDALAPMLLARSLVTRKTVTYHTLGLGLAPGQTQTIDVASRNVNNTFLITDVRTRDLGTRQQALDHHVTALEGAVYQTGWQDKWRQMTGGAKSGTAISGGPGVGGASGARYLYFFGGNGIDATRSPTPTWVPASGGSLTLGQGAIQIPIDTVARGSTTLTMLVRLRALESGVSVQARLYDVSAGAACPGLSTVVTSTTWQNVSFPVTLTAGFHYYELQLLPGTADADVLGAGFGV